MSAKKRENKLKHKQEDRSFGGELIKMHGEQDTEELIDKLKVSGGFAAVHNSIAQYVNSKEQDKERAIRKYFQFVPWMTAKIIGCQCPRVQLHNELVEFYKLFGPNEAEIQKRMDCFLAIRKIIRSHSNLYEKWKIKMFGSACTGMFINSKVTRYYGIDKSDIDIVVQSWIKLNHVLTALEYEGANYCNLHLVKAKVPLVKGTNRNTEIDFDICIEQDDGIKTTSLVKDFSDEFDELKYLVIFLKVLLSVNNLNKTYDGGISSFGLILLVVSYLQHNRNHNSKRKSRVKPLLSDHLLNIFKLYGKEFNYDKTGISVRGDGYYYSRDDKNFDMGMSKRVLLSLENPIEPNLNVAKGAYCFFKVKNLFRSCYEKIMCQRENLGLSLISLILPTKRDPIKV